MEGLRFTKLGYSGEGREALREVVGGEKLTTAFKPLNLNILTVFGSVFNL